jgi:hypothetical protein
VRVRCSGINGARILGRTRGRFTAADLLMSGIPA